MSGDGGGGVAGVAVVVAGDKTGAAGGAGVVGVAVSLTTGALVVAVALGRGGCALSGCAHPSGSTRHETAMAGSLDARRTVGSMAMGWLRPSLIVPARRRPRQAPWRQG